MFIWACDRYRADIRMVWEKCVAIMSNDDVDEGKTPSDAPLLSRLLFPSRLNMDDGSYVLRQPSVN